MQRDGLPDEFDRDREQYEDAQQRFAEQVADAIWALMPPDAPPSYVAATRALAPRVAAAIDTALYGSELEDHYRQKALAALRGEP